MSESESLNHLEKALSFGINGVPEIKKEERNKFLGELRERVVRAITFDRLDNPATKWEMVNLLKDTRVKKIILRQEIQRKTLDEYIKIINHTKVPFSLVNSPEYKSEIAILAVSDDAVDVDDVFVSSRERDMISKGIPIRIIKNVGSKLCDKCWKILSTRAPEEALHYEKVNFLDKICGFQCIACKE